MLWIVFLGISLLGCGAEVPSEPGEEVVSDKWVDPKDIGKEYRVNAEDIKEGDTVLLSDGETHEIGVLDSVEPADDGTVVLHMATAVPVPNKINTFRSEKVEKTIVLEGDPIVYLKGTYRNGARPVTKDRNVIDESTLCTVWIDRELDYHLPIYLESRVQDHLSGQVHVTRFIVVVLKGRKFAVTSGPESVPLGPLDSKKHERGYISVLPYTEMKKIKLPAETGFPGEGLLSPKEISVIPVGHQFRPYRIRSSSFFMEVNTSLGEDW